MAIDSEGGLESDREKLELTSIVAKACRRGGFSINWTGLIFIPDYIVKDNVKTKEYFAHLNEKIKDAACEIEEKDKDPYKHHYTPYIKHEEGKTFASLEFK